MSNHIKANSSPENPNSIPLGKRPHPPSPLPFRPVMSRDNYYHHPRGRSRSPLRPVQAIKIHEDGEIKEEDWAADKENLYNQIEKLTLRLDTVHSQVASHKKRIAELEKTLKEKETLVEQYQKRVRNDLAEKKDAHSKTKEVVEQCEKFKREVVKLSHEIHYLQNAAPDTTDAGRLRARCKKLRQERDVARDKLSAVQKANGRSLDGWPDADERVIKNEYL